MPGPVLLAGTYVDEGYLTLSHPPKKLFTAHRFHSAALFEKLPRDLLDFREPGFGQPAQRMEEAADVLIRETVLDVQALLLGVDEACGPEDLKVL